jgi:integrase
MLGIDEPQENNVHKRGKRGMPRVRINSGRYQVQVTYQGVTYTISPGLPERDKVPPKVLKLINLITTDLECAQFDTTLARYYAICNIKRQATRDDTVKVKPLTLLQCWEIFKEAKSKTSAETTVKIYYKNLEAWVLRIHEAGLTEPAAIREFLESQTGAKHARKLISGISGAINFCLERDIPVETILANQARLITLPKGSKKQPSPFSDNEVSEILDCLKSRHLDYLPIVKFLFLTGCRSSEAIGLKWRSVDLKQGTIHFENAIVQVQNSWELIEKGIKTEENREFPINPQLRKLLEALKAKNPGTYVFGVDGEPMRHSDLTKDAWNPCIKRLVELGKIRVRRSQYSTRATFITRMLKSGMPIADVARLVGNSPAIILKHYAGVSENLTIPDMDF